MIDDEMDRPATHSEACREYARNYGQDHPDEEWILTDFDTWERNPYYQGKPGPHPEDDRGEYRGENPTPAEEAESHGIDMSDDIPF